MTIGIAGLGLIGASLAKAYKAAGEYTVLGHDIDRSVIELACIDGVLDGELCEERIGECNLILVALYTGAAIEYMEKIAPFVKKECVVIDCCGTKRRVCERGFEIAKRYGFTYAGGHPMAGTQYSGFKYSRANLFKGASMIIVPHRFDDIELTSRIKEMLMPVGFSRITITTAEEHDRMIAFTSQLPHVVSNAFIKSPTAQSHRGFSAGSYKDLTRVAWLNENMWTELFFEDRDYLLYEIETVISSLEEYRDALRDGDRERMKCILREGRIAKEKVDKR
ncbi:MAG: prephenate dehydrogenase [Ruminococcaceae bacterium]|nr:prephenate dehydrogenase [Oscillospiraceae bacterium]